MLIFHDFARFRFAKEKLQFNDAVVRYGTVTGAAAARSLGGQPLRARWRQDGLRRGRLFLHQPGAGFPSGLRQA